MTQPHTDAFPLIVSYYTRDTLYQFDVKGLIESCEKWGLAYHIEPIESFGSWELNCSYKPFFLLSKLYEFKRPLFWVDVDGVFLKRPKILPEFTVDLAVRINSSVALDHPSRVISNSVFVNNTQEAELLLKLWARLCYQALSDPDRREEYWDQVGLRDALSSTEHRAQVKNLPHAYAAIHGHPVDQLEIPSPVVQHYQASRRYKKLINQR